MLENLMKKNTSDVIQRASKAREALELATEEEAVKLATEEAIAAEEPLLEAAKEASKHLNLTCEGTANACTANDQCCSKNCRCQLVTSKVCCAFPPSEPPSAADVLVRRP